MYNLLKRRLHHLEFLAKETISNAFKANGFKPIDKPFEYFMTALIIEEIEELAEEHEQEEIFERLRKVCEEANK